MAQVNDSVDENNTNNAAQITNTTENVLNNHLLKIDFPLVTQEYRESCKHYISTISERILDPNGYLTIKTKVDHYLYILNTENEIGKPLLSDIVLIPQEILTSYEGKKENDEIKEADNNSDECVVPELENSNFKNLQIKSNYKLVRRKKAKKYRKKNKRDSGESSDSSDEEEGNEDVTSRYCNCTEGTEDDSDSSLSCQCN